MDLGPSNGAQMAGMITTRVYDTMLSIPGEPYYTWFCPVCQGGNFQGVRYKVLRQRGQGVVK